MGNVNLNDVRGYFRELVTPNFSEFYKDYKDESVAGCEHLVLVYRRLVNLALTLNHQTDKTKSKLGYGSPVNFIEAIKEKYPEEGEPIEGAELLPEWKARKDSGETFEVCSSVVTAYVFWGKYFASERSIEQAT